MSSQRSEPAGDVKADLSAAALISASRFLQNGLGFLLSVTVLRMFGMPALGSVVLASVGVTLQAGLFNFGLPHVLGKLPLSLEKRNTIGFMTAVLGTLVCLPASLSLGAAFGHDAGERMAIAAFAFGGVCFAQAIVLDALLVLHGRVWLTFMASLGAAAGMLLGYLRADSLAEFALYLTLGRLAGIYGLFATLKYQWCGWNQFTSALRAGLRFIPPDMMALASEQFGLALLGLMASRAELGVFGLCRQFLSAAETPLWSRLMALYPRMCAEPERTHRYAREMSLMGLGIGASVALLSSVLAVGVFHSRTVLALAPLLMCAVPFRYCGGTVEVGLRALGRTTIVNRLGAIRLASLSMWPVGFLTAGLPGLVVVIVLQSACMAWFTLDAFRQSGLGAQEC